MDVGFKYTEADKNTKVFIEQVFAEKPGGGFVANPGFDVAPGTAVGLEGKQYKAIKGYRLTKAVSPEDSTIQIAKGSGIVSGDHIGHAKKAVTSTEVDTTSHADYDVVTVTLGVSIPAGTVLYEAKGASSSAAAPKLTPVYVTGGWVYANEGDQMVRLVNGANLRKETAAIAEEVAALLPTINLV